MNLVGKIFVFAVLAMSLVFSTMAVMVYGTHKHWKDMVENPSTGYKKKIMDEQAKQQELTNEIEKLKGDIAGEEQAKRKALADLETTRTNSDKKVKELEGQYADAQKANQDTLVAMKVSQDNLDKMFTEVKKLRDEIRDAQSERDKSFEQVVKLTDQLHQLTNEVTTLKSREGQLALQLASARNVLSRHSLSIGESDVPPPLRGKVLAVNQNDLLELSLGADDGIRTGNTLEVFRGNSYLGRVQVLTTQSDRAVAKILPDFKKGVIQKGDDVATRFKVG